MGFLRSLFGGGASAEKPTSGDMSATLIRRLSASKHELDGLPFDRNGHPRDVFVCGYQDCTGRRDKLSCTPSHHPVDDVESGESVYYLSPNEFALEFGCRDNVRIKITAKLDRTTASVLPEWLLMYVTKPGENITAEALETLLDGKCSSERLPEWLYVIDREIVAEPEKPSTPGEPPFAELKPGDVVFGSYRIERELGCGGQGRVFLATDTSAPTESLAHVVLKGLHGDDAVDGFALDAIIDEANILQLMRHDGIAAYHWCKMLRNVPVLAIEYIDGVSLADYRAHKPSGKISEDETRELLRPIADALDYAHDQKVFHRDVKPGNIIVRNTPRNGLKTCLIDFGIAGTIHSGTSGQPIGTTRYMSPGQKLGKPPSADMDVYSLAVTAYECLTGTLPYPHGWLPGVNVPPIPSDTPFARAVMRGLAMMPEDRPATCRELIDPPPLTPLVEEPTVRKKPDLEPQQEQTKTAETKDVPLPQMLSMSDELQEVIKKYRIMLSLCATGCANDSPEKAEWLRSRQAELRDLTKVVDRVDAMALRCFFENMAARLQAEGCSADDFFSSGDSYVFLVGLQNAVAQTRGPIFQAIKKSIGVQTN